jgi:hypothetical protein
MKHLKEKFGQFEIKNLKTIKGGHCPRNISVE